MAEKNKALETALLQIEKKYGAGAIMRLGESRALNVEAISTGSLALDMATGIGGLPKGRIVEIYGPESSGKTTLALHVVAEAQKAGGDAAFVDAEHALDPVSVSMWTPFWFPSRTTANRRSKLSKLWRVPVRWTLSSWTPSPLWCRARKSTAKWATATSVCRQD